MKKINFIVLALALLFTCSAFSQDVNKAERKPHNGGFFWQITIEGMDSNKTIYSAPFDISDYDTKSITCRHNIDGSGVDTLSRVETQSLEPNGTWVTTDTLGTAGSSFVTETIRMQSGGVGIFRLKFITGDFTASLKDATYKAFIGATSNDDQFLIKP
jgi:hypothetical protein